MPKTKVVEPDEIKMSVFASRGLHAKLVALAEDDGRTLARYIGEVLKSHVKRKEKTNA